MQLTIALAIGEEKAANELNAIVIDSVFMWAGWNHEDELDTRDNGDPHKIRSIPSDQSDKC